MILTRADTTQGHLHFLLKCASISVESPETLGWP